VPLIVGIIALTSDDTLATMINYIPGTSEVDEIMDLSELVKSGAIYFIILVVILIVMSSLGLFGACAKVKWMLYLVSNRHVQRCYGCCCCTRIFLLFR